MDVYRSLSRIPFESNTFITSGALDGIHLGHRRIVQRLLEKAQAVKGRTVVITFEPHPSAVIDPDASIELLTPLAEKLDLLSEMGLDAVLVVRFTRRLAGMEPDEFIRRIWVKTIGVRGCVIGYDHAFGKAKSGGLELLRGLGNEHGFSVDIVDPVTIGGETVSSTRIRSLLREGRMDKANAMLGRPYSITGIVVRGDRLGGKLGFATANLEPEGKNKLIPADGIYAARIEAGAIQRDGLVYIGRRPTVAGGKRRIEAHLFDFSGELYGERITVRLIDRLRLDQKFESVQALVEQMKRDREAAVGRFRQEKRQAAKDTKNTKGKRESDGVSGSEVQLPPSARKSKNATKGAKTAKG